MGCVEMDEWLEAIINGCKREGEKRILEEMKTKPLKWSMKIQAGTDIADFDIDLKGFIDKVVLPTQLLKIGFDGIENALRSLDMPLKKDCRIKGYSESEYSVPFYLEDEKRLVLIEPMLVSGLMEALGLGDLAYTMFSPLLALEFFKYVDIMNAQAKPTIMAFIGLTNFKEVADVNFFDFFKSNLDSMQASPSRERSEESRPKQNVFEFLPRNVFNIYGIPDFKIPLVEGLRLSRYDIEKNVDKRKIAAYTTSIGMRGFLNPNIVDYALFTTKLSGRTNPKTVSDIMQGGEALGHSPSKSKLLPDAKPIDVIHDPMILLDELKKQGMLTEITGNFKLTPAGLCMVNAEVKGKPKETTLSKIWNVVKKAKEVLPFLKFL
jgi:hypothetical protein